MVAGVPRARACTWVSLEEGAQARPLGEAVARIIVVVDGASSAASVATVASLGEFARAYVSPAAGLAVVCEAVDVRAEAAEVVDAVAPEMAPGRGHLPATFVETPEAGLEVFAHGAVLDLAGAGGTAQAARLKAVLDLRLTNVKRDRVEPFRWEERVVDALEARAVAVLFRGPACGGGGKEEEKEQEQEQGGEVLEAEAVGGVSLRGQACARLRKPFRVLSNVLKDVAFMEVVVDASPAARAWAAQELGERGVQEVEAGGVRVRAYPRAGPKPMGGGERPLRGVDMPLAPVDWTLSKVRGFLLSSLDLVEVPAPAPAPVPRAEQEAGAAPRAPRAGEELRVFVSGGIAAAREVARAVAAAAPTARARVALGEGWEVWAGVGEPVTRHLVTVAVGSDADLSAALEVLESAKPAVEEVEFAWSPPPGETDENGADAA